MQPCIRLNMRACSTSYLTAEKKLVQGGEALFMTEIWSSGYRDRIYGIAYVLDQHHVACWNLFLVYPQTS
jgi:hypothetical protein